MQQGATPDTISSDIHAVSINTPGYPTLPNVMSKLLNLGMTLDDVVAKATVEPAKIIGRVPGPEHAADRRTRGRRGLRPSRRPRRVRQHEEQQAERQQEARPRADRESRSAVRAAAHAYSLHVLKGGSRCDSPSRS